MLNWSVHVKHFCCVRVHTDMHRSSGAKLSCTCVSCELNWLLFPYTTMFTWNNDWQVMDFQTGSGRHFLINELRLSLLRTHLTFATNSKIQDLKAKIRILKNLYTLWTWQLPNTVMRLVIILINVTFYHQIMKDANIWEICIN